MSSNLEGDSFDLTCYFYFVFLSISNNYLCKSSLLVVFYLNSSNSFSRLSAFCFISTSLEAYSLFFLSSILSAYTTCLLSRTFSVFSLFSLSISFRLLLSSYGPFLESYSSNSSNSFKALIFARFLFCSFRISVSKSKPAPPLFMDKAGRSNCDFCYCTLGSLVG